MSLYDYIWKIMLRKIPYENEVTRYTSGHRQLAFSRSSINKL